jgi:hypothetical protein
LDDVLIILAWRFLNFSELESSNTIVTLEPIVLIITFSYKRSSK